jgi:N-acetylmuramoyl-L-alanine amidase
MRSCLALIGLLALVLAACAPVPQRASIPTKWQPSPNFDERRSNFPIIPRRPTFVIIHQTDEETAAAALGALTDPRRKLSTHYLVARNGTIYQLVDERARAWHAGESYWGGDSDLNSSSLGIELDNNGNEAFAKAQITALLALLEDIKQRNGIPTPNFLGHADVAPRRKSDPSRYFPWKTLAHHGFGLWCDAPYPAPPVKTSPATALQALGYDVSDVRAAIVAFKRHFVQHDLSPELTNQDRGLLHCLLERKRRSRRRWCAFSATG